MAFHHFVSRARQYGATLPSKDMVVSGVEELLEVSAASTAIGALEQRFGEQKTTLFMKDDPSGAVDENGDPVKQSGTGIPMSAAGAVLGTVATAFIPMEPAWRRRLLNVTTGLAAAFAYRKGIDWGQSWLDSKQPAGTPKLGAPQPPYGTSAASQAEIASVKGELNPVMTLQDLVNQQNDELARRRAANGR